jgi:hypothetical protein
MLLGKEVSNRFLVKPHFLIRRAAYHTGEIPYVFMKFTPADGALYTLSQQMLSYWYVGLLILSLPLRPDQSPFLPAGYHLPTTWTLTTERTLNGKDTRKAARTLSLLLRRLPWSPMTSANLESSELVCLSNVQPMSDVSRCSFIGSVSDQFLEAKK